LNFWQTIWDKTQVLLGISLGTLWELDGNTLGTREKTQKVTLPRPPWKEKKNWIIHECVLSLHIGCMKFLFPKLFVTIFGLG
jgi:hypothetical protein